MHQAYRSGLRTQVELAEEFGLTHAEMPREVRSSRSRVGGSGMVQEEICREIAPDVQWLKIALRAAERLQRVGRAPPTIQLADLGLAEEMSGAAEEMSGTNQPTVGAHVGPINWHKWHTPLGADLVATGAIEAESQAMTAQRVESRAG
jgi:hypothetical protein